MPSRQLNSDNAKRFLADPRSVDLNAWSEVEQTAREIFSGYPGHICLQGRLRPGPDDLEYRRLLRSEKSEDIEFAAALLYDETTTPVFLGPALCDALQHPRLNGCSQSQLGCCLLRMKPPALHNCAEWLLPVLLACSSIDVAQAELTAACADWLELFSPEDWAEQQSSVAMELLCEYEEKLWRLVLSDFFTDEELFERDEENEIAQTGLTLLRELVAQSTVLQETLVAGAQTVLTEKRPDSWGAHVMGMSAAYYPTHGKFASAGTISCFFRIVKILPSATRTDVIVEEMIRKSDTFSCTDEDFHREAAEQLQDRGADLARWLNTDFGIFCVYDDYPHAIANRLIDAVCAAGFSKELLRYINTFSFSQMNNRGYGRLLDGC